jgi:hypothetical protein
MPRDLLATLRESANLPEAVARLEPAELHTLIRSVGLEDCGDIVALASPSQLALVFDADLWRSDRPGLEAQFDADRFALWLEVLVDAGPSIAADKLAGLDVDFLTAALTKHLFVFDLGWRLGDRRIDFERSFDIGGYTVATNRSESWDAVVDALVALDAGHPDFLRRLLRECNLASREQLEIEMSPGDALDPRADQMSDVSLDRERRRDEQGFVPPREAAGFLDAAARLSLDGPAVPGRDPVAEGYARRMGAVAAALSGGPGADVGGADVRALLPAHIPGQIPEHNAEHNPAYNDEAPARLSFINTLMRAAYERDAAAYAARQAELGYLANVLFEGCTVNSRRFTGAEAYEAAAAVTNLGLENWPRLWSPITDDFLVGQDLVTVFRVGWTILHERVTLYAARRLDEALADLIRGDGLPELAEDLSELRRFLGECLRAGTPWRVCERLDAIAMLDLPTWALLLGILDRCPVVPRNAGRVTDGKPPLRVNSEIEFMSENRQIEWARRFVEGLSCSLAPGEYLS